MQWWNNATIKAFRERAQCIIDQYSRYKLDEIDLFVNGRMTQGENIADNGGLKQSFRASYIYIFIKKKLINFFVKLMKTNSIYYRLIKNGLPNMEKNLFYQELI